MRALPDAAYNQDSRFGRVFMSLEAEKISCVTRLGNRRTVREIPLADLQPVYERRKQRFPKYTLRLLMQAVYVGVGFYTVIELLRWFDGISNGHFVWLGYEFGAAVVLGVAIQSLAGLATTELVLFKNLRGELVLEIIRCRDGRDFEEFVAKLVEAIREAKPGEVTGSTGLRIDTQVS